MTLNEQLITLLQAHGADLIGFADVEGLAPDGYKYAVVAALALPTAIVEEIPVGPTPAYNSTYKIFNRRLDEMAIAAADLLNELGHRSMALCRENCPWDRENMSTVFPYKTSATRAGLGWVGKSGLLVTPEYGSAVRLTVTLTDAPIISNKPIAESRCGTCHACVDACPGKALTDTLWYPGIARDALVETAKCDQAARDIAEVTLGYRTTMCGRCFAACPYTKGYLNRANAAK